MHNLSKVRMLDFYLGTAMYNCSADIEVLHQDGCWVLAKWGSDE